MSDSAPRIIPAFDPADLVTLDVSGVRCTATVVERSTSPLLTAEWYVVDIADGPRPGLALARVDQLEHVATCRHCGEHGSPALHGDDGTCPRCALRDVLAGADVLADGEAVDAYTALSGAVRAFVNGASADDIAAAAQLDAPAPDFYGRDYIALPGDTFAGEPVAPGTLLRWDPTASTHYPAPDVETRAFALSVGFAPSDVETCSFDALRGMLAHRAAQDDRRDWIHHS